MTRINLVSPQELCDQHLLAELHELVRIPYGLCEGTLKVEMESIPKEFCLGRGHVKFFTNKLSFLATRYDTLMKEGLNRNWNIRDYWPTHSFYLPMELWEEFYPTEQEVTISRNRIFEKMPQNPRFYGKPLNLQTL